MRITRIGARRIRAAGINSYAYQNQLKRASGSEEFQFED